MIKKSKYNVDQTDKGKLRRTHNDILFDSELECRYYKYLLELQIIGDVIEIELQPKYCLFDKYIRKCDNKKILAINYVSDFRITYKKDNLVKVVDTKGNPDSVSLIKRKMLEGLNPDIDFHWISWSKIDGGWIEYDLLKEARKLRKKAKQNNK